MGETGFAGNWADGLQNCGTIVQQQRLIAFYLFYSTKPELRLMYKSNVTRQALMLHRLLHIWYFSYRVCMARWVSLWVGSLSLIPSRVVILHSLQHHFIISIHPFIVYHHSCSTQGCWSLSQLWWGEGQLNNKHGRVKQQFTLNLTGCMPILFMLWRHLRILMECLPEENHIHKTSYLEHAKQQDGGTLVTAGHINTLGVIFFHLGKLTDRAFSM